MWAIDSVRKSITLARDTKQILEVNRGPFTLQRITAGSIMRGILYYGVDSLTTHLTHHLCVGSFTMGSILCGVLYYGVDSLTTHRTHHSPHHLCVGSSTMGSILCGILYYGVDSLTTHLTRHSPHSPLLYGILF